MTDVAGGYAVTVDNGDTMNYVIAPVVGGDGMTAATIGNVPNPLIHTFYMAKSSQTTTYHDGDRSMNIEAGRNGYFNAHLDQNGSL